MPLATVAQRRAVIRHRRKASERGLARVEVQVPKAHSALLRRIAETLRTDPAVADQLARLIEGESPPGRKQTLGEFFDSLPDISGSEFDDVFERGRDRSWPRDVEL